MSVVTYIWIYKYINRVVGEVSVTEGRPMNREVSSGRPSSSLYPARDLLEYKIELIKVTERNATWRIITNGGAIWKRMIKYGHNWLAGNSRRVSLIEEPGGKCHRQIDEWWTDESCSKRRFRRVTRSDQLEYAICATLRRLTCRLPEVGRCKFYNLLRALDTTTSNWETNEYLSVVLKKQSWIDSVFYLLRDCCCSHWFE